MITHFLLHRKRFLHAQLPGRCDCIVEGGDRWERIIVILPIQDSYWLTLQSPVSTINGGDLAPAHTHLQWRRYPTLERDHFITHPRRRL